VRVPTTVLLISLGTGVYLIYEHGYGATPVNVVPRSYYFASGPEVNWAKPSSNMAHGARRVDIEPLATDFPPAKVVATPQPILGREYRRQLANSQWELNAQTELSSVIDSLPNRAYYDVHIECHADSCVITASIDDLSIRTLGPAADWETNLVGALTDPVLSSEFSGQSTKQNITSPGRIIFHTFLRRRTPS
jgi:hypothetical protein